MAEARYLGLTANKLAKIASDLDSENASLMGAAQGLGRLCDQYKVENAALRRAVKDAIVVQRVRCGDANMSYCRSECPLYREDTDDCLACDVISASERLGIGV